MDVYQRRRLVALSALAALFIIFVLLVRSCGGGDDETPVTPTAGGTGLGTPTALAAADYITQGDSICREANTSLARIETTDIEQSSKRQARIISGEYESLQTLELAEDAEGRDQLENFLGALQEQVAGLEDRAAAAARGEDVTAIDTVITEAAADAKKAGRKFGFEACGDPDEVSGSTETGTEAEEGTEGAVAPETTESVAPETTEPTVEPPATDTGAAPTEQTPPAEGTGGDPGTGGISP